MKTNTATKFRCEALIRGKWVVVSTGWSAIERDSLLAKGARLDLRFIAE